MLRLILLRVKKIPSSVFNSSDDMLSMFSSNALKFVPQIAVICVIAEFMPQSGFGTFHLLSKKSSRSNICTPVVWVSRATPAIVGLVHVLAEFPNNI